MDNFTFYNPTTLHFGKGVLEKLPLTLRQYGKKVLLVYGKGSIVKSGLYHRLLAKLKDAGLEVVEFSGIKSNPLVEDVDAAAELGRKENVDMILAVGGGSVIDSAKIISITVPVQHGAWDFYTYRAKPLRAIPLIAVLTLAATGTEMNPFAVLQNNKTGKKDGYRSDLIFPMHSFLDPELTYTVSPSYTAYGIADLIAHCLENYFGKSECTLTDKIIFSIIKDAIEWSPRLMANPEDYEARAAIMYDATMALNLITSNGKGGGDWGVHSLGHVLSLLFDVPHGASLSIIYPGWLKVVSDRAAGPILKFGAEVFGTEDVESTIAALKAFFSQIGSPTSLKEMEIGPEKHDEILNHWIRNRAEGTHYKFSKEEYLVLLREIG